MRLLPTAIAPLLAVIAAVMLAFGLGLVPAPWLAGLPYRWVAAMSAALPGISGHETLWAGLAAGLSFFLVAAPVLLLLGVFLAIASAAGRPAGVGNLLPHQPGRLTSLLAPLAAPLLASPLLVPLGCLLAGLWALVMLALWVAAHWLASRLTARFSPACGPMAPVPCRPLRAGTLLSAYGRLTGAGFCLLLLAGVAAALSFALGHVTSAVAWQDYQRAIQEGRQAYVAALEPAFTRLEVDPAFPRKNPRFDFMYRMLAEVDGQYRQAMAAAGDDPAAVGEAEGRRTHLYRYYRDYDQYAFNLVQLFHQANDQLEQRIAAAENALAKARWEEAAWAGLERAVFSVTGGADLGRGQAGAMAVALVAGSLALPVWYGAVAAGASRPEPAPVLLLLVAAVLGPGLLSVAGAACRTRSRRALWAGFGVRLLLAVVVAALVALVTMGG